MWEWVWVWKGRPADTPSSDDLIGLGLGGKHFGPVTAAIPDRAAFKPRPQLTGQNVGAASGSATTPPQLN